MVEAKNDFIGLACQTDVSVERLRQLETGPLPYVGGYSF